MHDLLDSLRAGRAAPHRLRSDLHGRRWRSLHLCADRARLEELIPPGRRQLSRTTSPRTSSTWPTAALFAPVRETGELRPPSRDRPARARLLHARGTTRITARAARRGSAWASSWASVPVSSRNASTSRKPSRCRVPRPLPHTELGLATAATNHNTRHPMVTASYATTMHLLTEGRFTLGLGRGIAPLFDAVRHPPDHHRADGGLRRADAPAVEGRGDLRPRRAGGSLPAAPSRRSVRLRHPDRADRVRAELARAWRAERSTPSCCTPSSPTTPCAVRSTSVRRSAEAAGRDPATVRIWSCYATIVDGFPEPDSAEEDRRTTRHLPTGLRRPDGRRRTTGTRPCSSASGPTRWSRRLPGAADAKATPEQLEHIATLIPDEWLEPAATGSPQRCAERVLRQFELGVDGVIMHGASPAELAPVVDAYADDPARAAASIRSPAIPGPADTERSARARTEPRPIWSRTRDHLGIGQRSPLPVRTVDDQRVPADEAGKGRREERRRPTRARAADRPASPVDMRPCRSCDRGCP